MNKSTNPKVSIIIPVYNVEQYLPQCIESCINQTFDDIEIILVDDGSTDSSGKICDEYALKDDRIKVIHKKNGGLSDARNKGTAAALGSYIMYLDSDDWIDTDTCDIAYTSAINYNVDVVFWSRIYEFPKKNRLETPIFDGNKIFDGKKIEWLQRRIIGLVGIELSKPTKTDAISSAWGKLYRKSLIIDNGLFFYDTKEVGSEDVFFNIQFFTYAKKALYIHKFLNHYRKYNPNSLTKNHNSTLFPRFLNLFKHIELFLDETNLFGDYRIALNNRITLSIINNVLSISSPTNAANFFKKIKSIDFILQNTIYKSAINELKFNYFPLHWKIFFVLCKYRISTLVYINALIMRRLRKT